MIGPVNSGRINLSLLSHTNVGKTTLARTLLRKDIGEVSDRPHVTEVAESHVLIESSVGDSLILWDTPGFGDSARVLKRLKQGEKPIGWFLTHVWDRFADRPFWCSQQAMQNARETSDVILYVVNAGEQPSSAGYIDAEMSILGWIGKPVILLLNQLGPPRENEHSQADVAQWQTHIAQYKWVEMVLPFDAFARCWVQEGTLLAHVQRLLRGERQQVFERLRDSCEISPCSANRCKRSRIRSRRRPRTPSRWRSSTFKERRAPGSGPLQPAYSEAMRSWSGRKPTSLPGSTAESGRRPRDWYSCTDWPVELRTKCSNGWAVSSPSIARQMLTRPAFSVAWSRARWVGSLPIWEQAG
jgi:GTPase SAR1 family protein